MPSVRSSERGLEREVRVYIPCHTLFLVAQSMAATEEDRRRVARWMDATYVALGDRVPALLYGLYPDELAQVVGQFQLEFPHLQDHATWVRQGLNQAHDRDIDRQRRILFGDDPRARKPKL